MLGTYRLGVLLALMALAANGPTTDSQVRPSVAGPDEKAAISLSISARPLDEAVRRIRALAGMHVRVDPDVRDWKVTVAWHGTALSLLRGICEDLGLSLETAAPFADPGGADLPTYRIRLPDGERDRLAAYYRKKRRQEAERHERDAALLARQIRSLLNRLDKIPDTPPGPGGDSALLNGAKPILPLIGSLGSDAVRQLTQSTEKDLLSPQDKTPALAIPVSSLSPGQSQLLIGFLDRERQS